MRKEDQTLAALAAVALIVLWILEGCRQTPPAAAPLVPQVSGQIEIAGLSAPVRVVRDRWGVAHIYARSTDDLFVAQGFVQAQDRLFQMDLWRRSVQGRLSEVLGPNFIERDAMTRRVQYRGDGDAEWTSYGPGAKAIAGAFVRGINAWVTRARERPPEEFVLAGWIPELWSPADLLNRTDAFLASGDAIDEARRAGFSDVIADALRRVGTTPFLSGLASAVARKGDDGAGSSPVQAATESTPSDQTRAGAAGHTSATAGGVLSTSEPRRTLDNPSLRYLVHLHGPGWNVIGATAPWLPGVAIGHNERVAWGMTAIDVDTEDIYIEAGSGGRGGMRATINEAIVVKGRRTPVEFEIEVTPHGVVIASDREHERVFTIRWSGVEPGTAAEVGALALDRAGTWTEFRAALVKWKMPARRVIYADVDGNVGFQDAALVPVRRRSPEWGGWLTLDDLPHGLKSRAGSVAAESPLRRVDSVARQAVFAHVLGISAPARRRFNVGPVNRRDVDDSPFRAIFDPAAWDRSRAIIAPGQSGSPGSAHFADLATLWGGGGDFTLAFTEAAVQANAESMLTLVGRGPR